MPWENMGIDRMTKQATINIKNRRQEMGISQEALAKEAGVSYRTILRFEKGNHIRGEKLGKIVIALEKLEKSGQKPGLWWLKRL